jgi:hypothetical protein
MDEQKKFDFTRADQLGLLRAVTFGRNGRVSPTVVKSVLRVIDDAGRTCWCSQSTIAERANCSTRSVGSAIAILTELGLITAVRGSRANEHRIVWTELELMVQKQQAEQAAAVGSTDTQAPATSAVHSALCDPNSVVCDRQVLQSDRQVLQPDRQVLQSDRQVLPTNGERTVKDPPPPTREEAGGGDFDFGLELQRLGINRWRSFAREFSGRDQGELREAITTYQANRSKFDSAAALIDYLRSGSWPVDGVMTCEQLAEYRTRPRRPAMSDEDQFIFGYRSHLMDRGLRGDDLIAAVDRGLARWRAEHAKPE